MKLFRHAEDRLPVGIILAYFLLDLCVYAFVDSLAWLTLWFLLGIFPKTNVCVWNHNHHHCRTFHHPWMNRLLEIVYGFQTGMLASTWTLHHIHGHHRHYLDQDRDTSRWQASGTTISLWRYIAEGLFLAYPRAMAIARSRPRLLRRYLTELSASLGILLALTVYRPLPALFVFWLPMLASLIVTMRATYYHHLELDLENPMAASRNVVDSKWLNILTGNIGYHTAHHHKCGLHWSRLPQLHKELEPLIPAHCYTRTVPIYYWIDHLDRLLSRVCQPLRRRPACRSRTQYSSDTAQ